MKTVGEQLAAEARRRQNVEENLEGLSATSTKYQRFRGTTNPKVTKVSQSKRYYNNSFTLGVSLLNSTGTRTTADDFNLGSNYDTIAAGGSLYLSGAGGVFEASGNWVSNPFNYSRSYCFTGGYLPTGAGSDWGSGTWRILDATMTTGASNSILFDLLDNGDATISGFTNISGDQLPLDISPVPSGEGNIKVRANFDLGDITNGLVSRWSFNASGANYIVDDDAGSNTGSALGGLTWLSTGGHDDNAAFEFDGTDSYVSVADSGTLDISGDFTTTAWVKRDGTIAGYPGVYDKGNTIFIRGQNSSSKVYMRVYNSAGSNATVTTSNALTDDTWEHIALVYDNGSMFGYHDGSPFGKTKVAGDADVAVNASDLTIGRNAGAYFSGCIDDVRLYDRALSEDEIGSVFQFSDRTPVVEEVSVSYKPARLGDYRFTEVISVQNY